MSLPVPENEKISGKFWPPFIGMLVLTPFLLIAGIGSAGAGHGDYLVAKLLFPFTMLSTTLSGVITLPFLILAIVQFPLYGVFLGLMSKARNLLSATVELVAVHLIAAITCTFLVGESFL